MTSNFPSLLDGLEEFASDKLYGIDLFENCNDEIMISRYGQQRIDLMLMK